MTRADTEIILCTLALTGLGATAANILAGAPPQGVAAVGLIVGGAGASLLYAGSMSRIVSKGWHRGKTDAARAELGRSSRRQAPAGRRAAGRPLGDVARAAELGVARHNDDGIQRRAPEPERYERPEPQPAPADDTAVYPTPDVQVTVADGPHPHVSAGSPVWTPPAAPATAPAAKQPVFVDTQEWPELARALAMAEAPLAPLYPAHDGQTST